MHVGNVLPYIIDKSFVQDCQLRCHSRGLAAERRYFKRFIHKVERRTAKMDLQRGGEIHFVTPITGDEIV